MFRAGSMRYASREIDSAGRALSLSVSGEKGLLKHSPPVEFTSGFLILVFFRLLEASCLLFANSVYMVIACFVVRLSRGLHE